MRPRVIRKKGVIMVLCPHCDVPMQVSVNELAYVCPTSDCNTIIYLAEMICPVEEIEDASSSRS